MSSVTLPATNSKVEVQPTDADPTVNRQVMAIGSKDGGAGDPLAEILAELTAILAKLIASPASAANQTTIIGHVDGIEASLASILAKIIAAPATEALQTALNALITTANGYLSTIATQSASADPAQTVGLSLRPTASFTRPANTTAYDVGDLVANSTTAGSVAAMTFAVAASAAGKGLIRSVKIDKAGVAATFRAHFFSAAPTVANGDNGAFSTTKANYLGYIEVATSAFSDGAAGIGLGEIPFDLSSGTNVHCLLETRTAFTPTSGGALAVEVTSWPEV